MEIIQNPCETMRFRSCLVFPDFSTARTKEPRPFARSSA